MHSVMILQQYFPNSSLWSFALLLLYILIFFHAVSTQQVATTFSLDSYVLE